MPRCPGCFVPMTRVEEQNLRYLTCPECFGTWINRSTLLRAVRGSVEAGMPGVEGAGTAEPGEASLMELAATVRESNTKGRLKCPDCQVEMRKDRYHQMIPVEIDRCSKCNGIWLDVGEKALIVRLWKELQTSDDPQVVALRDKVAGVASAWESRPTLTEEVLGTQQESINQLNEFSRILRILGGL